MKLLKIGCLTVLITSAWLLPAFPQAAGPGGGAPIDGGLSLLLAAGIGYGAKKMYQNRKQKKELE